MNQSRHPRGKFLALTSAYSKRVCGIALAGLTWHPVLATAEVVNSASPVSPEIKTLEATSTSASDLVLEAPSLPPASPGETEDVPVEATPSPTPTPDDAASARSHLTGDWGGVRSQLEDQGVTLDLEFTQFYQGYPQILECGICGSPQWFSASGVLRRDR